MTLSMPVVDASGSTDQALGLLIEELTAKLQAGAAVDVQGYLQEHPEHEARLRPLLPALEMLADLGRSAAAGAVGVTPLVGPGEEIVGTLGDFRIVREIGRGGMGVVYEAEQISLGRRVALKVLPFAGTLDARQLQRFKNEAQAAAHLQHQNIVPVHAVGCERGVHYYAMQYVEGQTLAALIKDLRREKGLDHGESNENRGPKIEDRGLHEGASDSQRTGPFVEQEESPVGRARLLPSREGKEAETTLVGLGSETAPVTPRSSILDSPSSFFRTVANLGIQAAEALEHAHQLGVIHGDIKPANMMVDARGNLWITDFGLAHCQASAELTMSGDLLGTLRYMSPEQALAKRVTVDERTDIYSLGVTLYELLTLEPAFPGTDRQEVLRRIAFEEPRPPRRWNKRIPADLETVVLKAIQKNPGDRYATAQEMAEDLERFVKQEPIRARRPSWRQHAKKWIRRHPGVTGTAAVSAVVILLLAVAGLWANNLMIRAEQKLTKQERDRAEHEKEAALAREAEREAVLDFVENKVFAAARPKNLEGGQGYDVKLADAVKAALPFVEKSFTGQPLIEARLRMTMGLSFKYLGDAKTAIEQYQAARDLYTEHVGPDHPDTLTIMNNLANSYGDAGRTQEALKLHEETLELRKAKLGPDHLDTLQSMNNLATSYADAGRTQEALKLLEKTLQLMKAKLGPDHPDTLMSMNNLANSYDDAGRTQEALKLHEETLQLQKAKLGPDHLDTLMSMLNLATSYARTGRTQEALKLFEKTVPLCKAKLGPDHPDTLASMHNLANSYHHAGRTQEALKLDEETLQLQKTKLGPDHPDTLRSMNGLANSYLGVGQAARAVAILQDTLTLRERRLKADPGNTVEQSLLAMTHGQMGNAERARLDYAAAVRAYARCVEMFEKLDQAGALKDPFFRGELDVYRQGLELCSLLKEQKLPAAVETAAKIKKRAGDKARPLYDAACAYAMCAAAAKQAKSPVAGGCAGTPPDSEKLANEAMALLKQAVAKGFKDAVWIKHEKDLELLRDRPDFQKLLAELEAAKKD